eukprot:tig00021357_g20753.t1
MAWTNASMGAYTELINKEIRTRMSWMRAYGSQFGLSEGVLEQSIAPYQDKSRNYQSTGPSTIARRPGLLLPGLTVLGLPLLRLVGQRVRALSIERANVF